MWRTKGPYYLKDVPLNTITVDEDCILNTISIDRTKPVQNSIQHEHACNDNQITPSLNDAPLATKSNEHLNQLLFTDTDYVFRWSLAHKQARTW